MKNNRIISLIPCWFSRYLFKPTKYIIYNYKNRHLRRLYFLVSSSSHQEFRFHSSFAQIQDKDFFFSCPVNIHGFLLNIFSSLLSSFFWFSAHSAKTSSEVVMESSNYMGLMAVMAASGSVVLVALQAHRRLVSDFRRKFEIELNGMCAISSQSWRFFFFNMMLLWFCEYMISRIWFTFLVNIFFGRWVDMFVTYVQVESEERRGRRRLDSPPTWSNHRRTTKSTVDGIPWP